MGGLVYETEAWKELLTFSTLIPSGQGWQVRLESERTPAALPSEAVRAQALRKHIIKRLPGTPHPTFDPLRTLKPRPSCFRQPLPFFTGAACTVSPLSAPPGAPLGEGLSAWRSALLDDPSDIVVIRADPPAVPLASRAGGLWAKRGLYWGDPVFGDCAGEAPREARP